MWPNVLQHNRQWRASSDTADCVVLDIFVQPRRDANAAKRFFKRLLKGLQ